MLEGDRLDVLATLVEAYESVCFPIDAPDPFAAILFMREQKQLTRRGSGRTNGNEALDEERLHIVDEPVLAGT